VNQVGSWRWPCGFFITIIWVFNVVWVLIPNFVVLVVSNFVFILGNEGGGPHHMQGHHTQSLWIDLRKLVVSTLNIHQIFN
jgi:hypothetical protein